MLIEANLWMNHTVLSGISEPDMIIINRRTGALSMESEGRGEICLTPRQLVQLHAIARKIEDRMNEDISVDWAYDNGKLYVLHTRPFSQKTHERFK
jgi:phosphoenolpyruvate synthase/pyruvate phosphate dikinase